MEGVEGWSIVWKEMVNEVEGKVFKACVITSMVYYGETWTLIKAEAFVLRHAERATMRMMSGVRLRQKGQ